MVARFGACTANFCIALLLVTNALIDSKLEITKSSGLPVAFFSSVNEIGN